MYYKLYAGPEPQNILEKTEAAIEHKDVHLGMRSDRTKVGQLIRISNPNAEMILFLSCIRFLQ